MNELASVSGRVLRIVTGFALLLGSACGQNANGREPVGGGDAGSAGTGAAPGTAGTGTAGMAPVLPPGPGPSVISQCDPSAATAVGPTPLRRISQEEYNHAVRDLLGDDTRPADQGGFPSDEKVGSFISNTATLLTASSTEGYLLIGEKVAAGAMARFAQISGCSSSADMACTEQFLLRTARRAFHGTLDPEASEAILAQYRRLTTQIDPAGAAEVALRGILMSPRFLYVIETGQPQGSVARLTPQEVSGRLASFLWRSVPDQALLDLADSGGLATPEQVMQAAERMLGDPRAVEMLDSFVLEWLNVGAVKRFVVDDPAFTPALRQAMLQETLLAFRGAFTDPSMTYPRLLTADSSQLSPELATLYGATHPSGTGTALTPLPANRRGILLQSSFLATRPSQVVRGRAVREQILCDRIPDPPPGVERNPEIMNTQTAQQVFDEHAARSECAFCHKWLDPVGRGFGFFDELGRYADTENGIPLSAQGQIVRGPISPLEANFNGAIELVQLLAGDTFVQQCFATQVNRYALGRNEQTADACSVKSVWDRFSGQQLNLKSLFVAVTGTDAFLNRNPVRAGEMCR